MKINSVLVGPFIGDFESEINDFRPYSRWVYEILRPVNMFISTHFNRQFLYEGWSTVLPVCENYTRDEINQIGAINFNVTQKEMLILFKKVKYDLTNTFKINKDLLCINVPYSKVVRQKPPYKKIFTGVNIPKTPGDYILFIPSTKSTKNEVREIYDFLVENFNNVIISGDMKTHLYEKNDLLKDICYFNNIYYDITKLITNAKVVITPTSHWTTISMMQKTPVFSWGNLKYVIEYDFNTKNTILPLGVDVKYLKPLMYNFIKQIEGKI